MQKNQNFKPMTKELLFEKRYKCLVCKRENLLMKRRHICNGEYKNPNKWELIMMPKKEDDE